MDFGKILKELRTEKGFSQKQLAEKIGCTFSPISFMEMENESGKELKRHTVKTQTTYIRFMTKLCLCGCFLK
jgi:transcriptional regulator with XRE-family HTH domain